MAMKDTKITKEIVINGNSSIIFGEPNHTNGNMLIFGNFDGICGKAVWKGEHSNENGWYLLDDFDISKYDTEVIATNAEMIVNTIKSGNVLVFAGSTKSIDYWKSLLYNMMHGGLLAGENPAHATIKRIFKNQVRVINTDYIYENAARKYGDVKTTLSENELNKRIKEYVINTLFGDIKKSQMKFETIVLNPPYNGSLHLEVLMNSLDFLASDGWLRVVEPATWLINVRKNGKASIYDQIKARIKNHVKSVEIENLNKDFRTGLYVPFSITTIDMSQKFDTIEFICCGEHKEVDSIYDCNLIGKYETIWSILEKVQKYGDMMCRHITNENMGENVWYIKYDEILPCGIEPADGIKGLGRSGVYGRDTNYITIGENEYLYSYIQSCFNRFVGIVNEIPKKLKGGSTYDNPKYSDNNADCIYGSKEELENWKHFIFNNKLSLFINIVMTIDQNNNSKEFLPWLVDKHYTDEEINEMFGFTDEEIKLIDHTLKKFERKSPWFKRYMCGKDKKFQSNA